MMRPEEHEELKGMLSAYLDQELTQAASQRVRIHLEDCAGCRETLRQFRELQRLTAQVRFPDPPEEKMEELERRISVRAPRGLGWLLVLGGLAAWLIYALAMAVLHWRPPTPEEMLGGAIGLGVLLLFISVLRQRLLELPHDRYRSVKK